MKNFLFSRKSYRKRCFPFRQFLRMGVLFLWLIFSGIMAYSQDLTVSGEVTNSDGEPLPGVNINIKGTTRGVTTDLDGLYSIDAESGSTLVFSFVGMLTQEIKVKGRTTIDVVLSESTVGLDEVVVIGYGKQSRKTITTSISRVSSEELEEVAVTSVSTALQGKLAGARVYQSKGGQPGSDATIRVRGGSSINKSNSPLVIIDGAERNLNDINPNDIESVQVLKDASSTAIYGARASNGVILVTTKKGKLGKAEINFNMNTGFATPWKTMDLVGARDYLSLVREAASRSRFADELGDKSPWGTGNGPNSPYSTRILAEGEQVPEGYQSMIDPVDSSRTLVFEDNDFQDLTFDPALEQTYNLSANGGTESIKYAASVGYSNIEGSAIGTKYERFTGRANVDFSLRDNLTLSTRMDHSAGKTNEYPGQRAIFNRSIWMAPTARIYLDDGSLAPGKNESMTNPLWYNDVNVSDNNVNRTGVGASLEWNVLPGLQAEVSGDYYVRNRTYERFEKSNVYNANRNAVFQFHQTKQFQFEGLLRYDKTFANAHHVNMVAGVSQLYAGDLDTRSQAEGGNTDRIMTLNAAPLKLDASTSRKEEALLGMFGRVTYDYKQKYLLGLSLRRDASSRFAPENRVGYFPGASLGWIVTEEQFMQSIPVINTLKLRGSYGQTGNNSVGRYAYAGVYNTGNNYYGMAGVLPSDMPNKGLQWETTTQWDVGFDLGLFDYNRISLLFDYYNKITSNLLFNVPLPNESGFNNIDQNIGKVKFYGYEFELQAKIIDKGDFNWISSFNLGYVMNEVLELPDNGREKNRIGGILMPEGESIGGIAEGERMYNITGYLSDGIIDTWEEAENANWDSEANGYSPLDGNRIKGRKIPGDMEWVDRNGDGMIDDFDKVVLGYSVPTTTGGFGNKFRYKNFDLKVFVDYALGHSISDAVIRRSDGNVNGGAYTPLSYMLTDAWTKEGDVASGKASMPRFDLHDKKHQKNYMRTSDRSVHKGDFLCLREVKLGYSPSKSFANSIGMSRLRITLSAQNLYYFTAYNGWTPEYASEGGNYKDNTYPVSRKIMLGVQIGF